jgi:pyruvate/2-oxoglutarate dehydrogenase complex dihydrolipoamide acyltransferase (E2) component
MGTPVCIPKLGIGMNEGALTQWLVADGDRVEPGTPLYILETDKVENEVEAVIAGVVHLGAEAGNTYPVGTQVAEIVGD